MSSYWDWAVEVHGREGVDAALTGLQDAHGQSVAYLLWAAWAAHEGRRLGGVLLLQAAELTRHWEEAATGPLRGARRALKAPAPPIEDAARLALREDVRKAEFAAERLLMETLERLAPDPEGSAGDLAHALLEASGVWGEAAPERDLRELASRLA
jgi:uncharacterized protein (TIGR02444 family)